MGSMLASKLSPRFRYFKMLKIRIPGQGTSANPAKILEAFHDFYTNLYGPHKAKDNALISDYLDSLPIPSLSTEHREILEAPLLRRRGSGSNQSP